MDGPGSQELGAKRERGLQSKSRAPRGLEELLGTGDGNMAIT